MYFVTFFCNNVPLPTDDSQMYAWWKMERKQKRTFATIIQKFARNIYSKFFMDQYQ